MQRQPRWWLVVVGVLIALMGGVWALQGAGILGGSAMSNETQWLVIGLPVAALGLWLAWRGLPRR